MSAQGFAKSMHSLEAELGVPLFVMGENGQRVPTEYADEFFALAGKWGNDYKLLFERFDRIRARNRDEIRLGTSLGVIGLFGPEFINGFKELYPDISVTYNELPDLICDDALQNEMFDLTFSLFPFREEFITTELYSSTMYFWMKRDDPLSTLDVIHLEDLEDRCVAIPGKDIKVYERILGECARRGITIKEEVTSNEIFWIYEVAASGRGLGFATEHLARLPVFNNDDEVIAVPFDEKFQWRIGVSYLPSHPLTKYEQAFYDYCLEYNGVTS
jgi:DNA-binding transcriptional LysR family regulator